VAQPDLGRVLAAGMATIWDRAAAFRCLPARAAAGDSDRSCTLLAAAVDKAWTPLLAPPSGAAAQRSDTAALGVVRAATDSLAAWFEVEGSENERGRGRLLASLVAHVLEPWMASGAPAATVVAVDVLALALRQATPAVRWELLEAVSPVALIDRAVRVLNVTRPATGAVAIRQRDGSRELLRALVACADSVASPPPAPSQLHERLAWPAALLRDRCVRSWYPNTAAEPPAVVLPATLAALPRVAASAARPTPPSGDLCALAAACTDWWLLAVEDVTAAAVVAHAVDRAAATAQLDGPPLLRVAFAAGLAAAASQRTANELIAALEPQLAPAALSRRLWASLAGVGGKPSHAAVLGLLGVLLDAYELALPRPDGAADRVAQVVQVLSRDDRTGGGGLGHGGGSRISGRLLALALRRSRSTCSWAGSRSAKWGPRSQSWRMRPPGPLRPAGTEPRARQSSWAKLRRRRWRRSTSRRRRGPDAPPPATAWPISRRSCKRWRPRAPLTAPSHGWHRCWPASVQRRRRSWLGVASSRRRRAGAGDRREDRRV